MFGIDAVFTLSSSWEVKDYILAEGRETHKAI